MGFYICRTLDNKDHNIFAPEGASLLFVRAHLEAQQADTTCASGANTVDKMQLFAEPFKALRQHVEVSSLSGAEPGSSVRSRPYYESGSAIFSEVHGKDPVFSIRMHQDMRMLST